MVWYECSYNRLPNIDSHGFKSMRCIDFRTHYKLPLFIICSLNRSHKLYRIIVTSVDTLNIRQNLQEKRYYSETFDDTCVLNGAPGNHLWEVSSPNMFSQASKLFNYKTFPKIS